MKRFEIGKSYYMRSACDHECVWTFTVAGRTAKTITITDGKETRRCKIIEKPEGEYVLPFGRYAFAPVLRAERSV